MRTLRDEIHARDEEVTMGLDDMLNKAKDAASNMSDEQIDDVANKIKDKTSDGVDSKVDALAEQAKKLND